MVVQPKTGWNKPPTAAKPSILGYLIATIAKKYSKQFQTTPSYQSKSILDTKNKTTK
jgi:hypothetical protein